MIKKILCLILILALSFCQTGCTNTINTQQITSTILTESANNTTSEPGEIKKESVYATTRIQDDFLICESYPPYFSVDTYYSLYEHSIWESYRNTLTSLSIEGKYILPVCNKYIIHEPFDTPDLSYIMFTFTGIFDTDIDAYKEPSSTIISSVETNKGTLYLTEVISYEYYENSASPIKHSYYELYYFAALDDEKFLRNYFMFNAYDVLKLNMFAPFNMDVKDKAQAEATMKKVQEWIIQLEANTNLNFLNQ